MKYFIYTRKSSESEDRQILSIEAQLRELRDLAEKEQLEIAASFEEAKTAKEPGRIVFAEMLAAVERGEAQGILSWHPDRLARNSVDGGRIIHLLDTGALKSLKFSSFWFESTPQGKFMLNIAFGQSKYYVDNLSENVKRGIRQKLRCGEWPALAPVGYINNLKTKLIEVDSERASLIRKAFKLFASGDHSLRTLAKALKEIGLRSHKENVLSISSVHRMLQNPVYYGMITRKGELYEGTHEPIISKNLFDEVQMVIAGRARKKRKRKHEYLFSGCMTCGCCACAITAERQKGYIYYRCTKKKGKCDEKYLREETLLEQVRDIVEQVTLPDDWAENMLIELDREKKLSTSDHWSTVRSLESEKVIIEAKLDTLLDLHLEAGIDRTAYVQKKNALLNRKHDIEQKITKSAHKGDDRLEPIRELIISSQDAKKYLSDSHKQELPTFLKKIGSNWILQDKTVRYEARKGWRVLRQRPKCSDWLSM
ncbi:recombinase family protein [Patescibacteria group bacterium]|nr:recombinase family protein [Patescibacteria group bacterium]